MLSWQTTPLRLSDVPVASPAPGELLVRVLACGVCRTDLHVVDGDLPVHRLSVVPGHQVVGEVVVAAPGFVVGERVGIAWLRHTCGACRFCLRGAENLCPASLYTGWDADGGYASYAVVPAAYALRLPSGYSSEALAPLLCAGIIGYRALKLASVPDGGRLGIYGFGGSAHLAAQVAVARGYEVHVVTRSSSARALAMSLGAASVSADAPPVPVDSAVLFAPVGTLVPPALEALDRGGTLAIAGIHLSDVPVLNYSRHLFQERVVRSVTANTRADAAEFLSFCASHRLSVAVQPYPLASANLALADLRAGRVTGAAVLVA
ncbi:zinc-binding alcohol dehydrogenase family protein [Lentzea alba]|uniref:zinc-binding alcohol dehydrogenase family protein n=1 Tax=Lentzea alba TaxID=2714351 RepID=UPI0028BF11E2|nr:zinc-binding alcohol dehydrogenase family protein [Lentzea alba]